MGRQTALATLLAHIGRLKVLNSVLAEADATEAQTVLDVRAVARTIENRKSRAEILVGVQAAASRRRIERRAAVAGEINAIALGLPALAAQAQVDLDVLAAKIATDGMFKPSDDTLFRDAA